MVRGGPRAAVPCLVLIESCAGTTAPALGTSVALHGTTVPARATVGFLHGTIVLPLDSIVPRHAAISTRRATKPPPLAPTV
jgi:hypothetical protein